MNKEMLDRFYVELTNPDEMGITDSRLKDVFEMARHYLLLRSCAQATLTEQRREFARGEIADLDALEDALDASDTSGESK